MKTSDLVVLLVHPPTVGGISWIEAIAAEIDRRIPVPDPRIGKLCVPALGADPVRVVGVEAGGLLRCRADGWPREAVEMRVDPDTIAPSDWIEG